MREIYIKGEIPKGCSECEWFTANHCSKNGRNFCVLTRMPFYNTEKDRKIGRGQHKDSLSDFDCPLQSLTEHDKQIRKEVVREIKDIAGDYFELPICFNCGETSNDDVILTGNDLTEILDQIEGEDNGKIDNK